MSLDIHYIEDDDEPTPVTQRPRVPPQAQRDQPNRAVVPPRAGATWFVCSNEACSHVGYVATGAIKPVKHSKKRACRECGGHGVVDLGDPCDACGASGKVVVREWEEDPVNPCPWCRQPMDFLQQGGFPAGYPRMETPHTDQIGEMSGNIGFGRTRKVE